MTSPSHSIMSDYLSVQHPIDPARAEFDFWVWRLFRRFIVDHLHSASMAHQDSQLTEIANRLEVEQMRPEDLAYVEQILGVTPHQVRTTRGLLRALADWNREHKVEVQQNWFLPTIRPDWSAIPISRPIFIGRVGPDQLSARLPESLERVPDYRIIWIDAEGEEQPPEHVRNTPVGEYIEYAPALWDWLFARRLTLLCLNGIGSWPEGMRPPMLLAEDWQSLPRPF